MKAETTLPLGVRDAAQWFAFRVIPHSTQQQSTFGAWRLPRGQDCHAAANQVTHRVAKPETA
jgi:hypothetical protein